MIEPAASPRLQRARDAYESSLRPLPDAILPAPAPLRADAATPHAHPPVPPLPLPLRASSTTAPATATASSSFEPARAPIPPLADGYLAFRERAFGAEAVSAAFLATIAAQAAALALVWEAHARGVVTLPPAVAAAVGAARAAPR